LAGTVEFFLCGAFQNKNSAPSSGWWCDGVIEVSVRQLETTAFQLAGVAFWAESGNPHSPFYLAPFELEVYYSSPGDLCSSRVIVRFGQVDRRGGIVRTPYNRLLGRRPKSDAQWAFAIELS
jgi:hypothetical protein